MAPPLLALRTASLGLGRKRLFDQLDVSLAKGERVCLIGRNGAGKSTLLKVLAGMVELDSGERFLQPRTVVSYLPQEPDFGGHATALSFVAAACGVDQELPRGRYTGEAPGRRLPEPGAEAHRHDARTGRREGITEIDK